MTRARDLSNDEANNGGATPPFVAGKNKIINGDFSIWQRGTTTTSVGYFTADRWYCGTDATATFSRQVHTPGAAPVAGYEGQYFMRLAKNSGGSYVDLRQYVEDVRTLAGQTVTLSFWAKCGSGTESLEPYYSQDFGASGSAGVSNSVTAQTITTSWARYSFTFTLPSISGKTIGANSFTLIYAARSINSSSARTIDVWGVQLEAGPLATPFTPAGGGFPGAELALCQRYYTTSIPTDFTITNFSGMNQGSSSAIGWCSSGSTNDIFTTIQYPVPMRTAPTFVIYSAGNRTAGSVRDAVTGSDLAVGNYSVQAGNNKGFNYMSGFTATAGRPYSFQWTASAEF
jgi:hypothetical protein